MEKYLNLAKWLSILGFLCLLCSTYLIRSEVLELNEIRFSSESLKSDKAMRELRKTIPCAFRNTRYKKRTTISKWSTIRKCSTSTNRTTTNT